MPFYTLDSIRESSEHNVAELSQLISPHTIELFRTTGTDQQRPICAAASICRVWN